VARDGREDFRSTKVPCPHCLRQLDPQGRVHYSHKIVGATVGRAGSPQGVPLDGEEGRNATAESAPQDWELTAGTRLSTRLRRAHPQMALLVIGEDLYSHVPFVEQLQPLRQPSVLVAKPSSPPTLRAAVTAAAGTDQTQTGQWTQGPGVRQRTYTYRRVRHLSLALESAVRGTEVEVWEHTATGELRSHNRWSTDLDVNAANGAVGVQLGRTRWKMDNKQGNVPKHHGSELTHNDGHGQPTFAMGFSLLPLRASGAHVVLALGDRLSQRCRTQEARRALGKALRTLGHGVLVESWPHW
jgi:hypothetical protein